MRPHQHVPGTGGTFEVSVTREAPRVDISTTDRPITAQAGAVLIRQALRGFAVPAPQTAGSFLRRFTLGHIRALDVALRAVHRRAFELLGIGPGDRLTLDFDSSYVRSYSSRRQGADPTWTKRYTLHPLMCFVAEFATCLHAKPRRGRAGSSTGIAPFVTECLRRVPAGVHVRARFDSAFYSSKLFADLERRGVTYICGVPFNPRLLQVIRGVPDADYAPCVDKEQGEVPSSATGLRVSGCSAATWS